MFNTYKQTKIDVMELVTEAQHEQNSCQLNKADIWQTNAREN